MSDRPKTSTADDTPAAPKREPRKDRKACIREAAIELFAKQGFQATSTAEVAKLAGVSEGTIFYHFQTKEGILLSLMEDKMVTILADMEKALAEAPNGLEAVLECMRIHMLHKDMKSRESLILVRDMPASFADPESPYRDRALEPLTKMMSMLSRAIQLGLDDGTVKPCDPKKLAAILIGLFIGTNRLRMLSQLHTPHIGQDAIDFCRQALESDRKPGSSVNSL